jgi:low affinity Fe/Cu permease
MTLDQGGLERVRAPGSSLLHAIDRLTSRPVVAWVLLSADLVWVAFSTLVGFPVRLETIFQTLVAALTLALVFVIQHTQGREQLVTQRKLDEILRALPHADNAVIGLEEASDFELASLHADHRALRDEATNGIVD